MNSWYTTLYHHWDTKSNHETTVQAKVLECLRGGWFNSNYALKDQNLISFACLLVMICLSTHLSRSAASLEWTIIAPMSETLSSIHTGTLINCHQGTSFTLSICIVLGMRSQGVCLHYGSMNEVNRVGVTSKLEWEICLHVHSCENWDVTYMHVSCMMHDT